jgi:hypothetical protein
MFSNHLLKSNGLEMHIYAYGVAWGSVAQSIKALS